MGVELQRIVEKMKLKNLTPEVDLTKREVKIPDINRPALQLAGFFDHFESQRVQIIGYVEYTYLETLSEEQREKIYVTLMSYGVPCFSCPNCAFGPGHTHPCPAMRLRGEHEFSVIPE